MLGQVGRAIELPISLSIGIARKGVGLTFRIAGWALTGVVRELSPDISDGRAQSPDVAYDQSPAQAPPPEVVIEETLVTENEAPEPPADPEAAVLEEHEADLSGGEVPGAEVSGGEVPGVEVPGVEEVEHEPGVGTSVRERSPHSALNNPVTEPDLTEWPDPYDHREDPRDPGDEMVFGGEAVHPQTGATSTSEPHPSQDPEAEPSEGPKRDKVDR